MKKILISFADSRYKESLEAIEANTKSFAFDERYFLTERNSLTKQFWKKTKPWLYRRGYGYWSWKAPIIKEYINNLQEGDICVWSDAGNYWNNKPEAVETFHDYISLLSEEKDILVFNQRFNIGDWTKGDILQVTGIYDDEIALGSPQCIAAMLFIKKTCSSTKLINRWCELSDIDKELITDKRSTVPNKPNFKENRHDQAILSALLLTYKNVIFMPESEVMVWDGNWERLKDKPIQVRRTTHKGKKGKDKYLFALTKPWRYLLYLYFKYYRHYDFMWRYMG